MTAMQGDKAMIVKHCAVFGTKKYPARKFSVSEVRPHAQYPVSVTVYYTPPRVRRSDAFTVCNDDLTWLSIERGDVVLYDSRADVPCDMAKWWAVRAKWAQHYSGDEP
jgi:hypothetical protein